MPSASRLAVGIVVFMAFSAERRALADADFIHDGHRYTLVEQGRTWAAAAADATTRQVAGLPGYLTVINSAAENQAIFNQLTANITAAEYNNTRAPDGGGGVFVWIAANDVAVEGDWIWDGDGNGVGTLFYKGLGNAGGGAIGGAYQNWGFFNGGPWEPDNGASGLQDAGGIGVVAWPRGQASQWNDVRVDNSLYYVVEFDAIPEPSSCMLIAFGGVMASNCVRRSRRSPR